MFDADDDTRDTNRTVSDDFFIPETQYAPGAADNSNSSDQCDAFEQAINDNRNDIVADISNDSLNGASGDDTIHILVNQEVDASGAHFSAPDQSQIMIEDVTERLLSKFEGVADGTQDQSTSRTEKPGNVEQQVAPSATDISIAEMSAVRSASTTPDIEIDLPDEPTDGSARNSKLSFLDLEELCSSEKSTRIGSNGNSFSSRESTGEDAMNGKLKQILVILLIENDSFRWNLLRSDTISSDRCRCCKPDAESK